MQNNIFDTPVLSPILRRLARPVLSFLGWQITGNHPGLKKFVLIAAPHTSNWDVVVTLLLAFSFNIKIYWMGKESLFMFPFRPFMRWLGGIPIDRSKAHNVVDETVRVFNEHEELVITVPPEGTRGKVRYWKTGFYYIAHGAGIPIVLGYIDWARKFGGLGPTVTTTGNIEADMAIIKNFYADITGKHGDRTSKADVKGQSEKNNS